MVENGRNRAVLGCRHREILVYTALGCSHEETAYFLGISVHTVRSYLRQILEKLGARGRADAVMLALLEGLLDLETLKEVEEPKVAEIDWTGGPLVEQVVKLVSQGYLNKEISHALGTSEQYIKNCLFSTTKKLGARNRVHLIILSLIQRKLDLQGLRIEMATK